MKPKKGAVPPPPAKSKKHPFDRVTELAALKERINGQFKRQVLVSGDQFTNVYVLRRPTGYLSLDVATCGGLPAGALIEVIGKEGGGKTYLSNRIISNVQNIYGADAAISVCMTENRYDKTFAKYKCGVRVAYSKEEIAAGEVAMGRPYSKDELAYLHDQVGTFDIPLAGTAEQLLEIAAQQVESNLYQLIVIDSLGALLTNAEAEAAGGITDKHYGGAATAITAFMHRVHNSLVCPDSRGRPNLTTILAINQYRENVGGGMYASPMRVSGGYALKHGKVIDLLLSPGRHITIGENSVKITVGKEIHWELTKGKAGCHDGPKGSYNFYFGDHNYPFGIDAWEDMLVVGVGFGVVEQAGAWFSYKGERIGQGALNAGRFLYEHPDIAEDLRATVFDRANIHCINHERDLF